MVPELPRQFVHRASCRRFADRTVEPDVLRRLLDAGVHSPTGGNLQPYSIIQVDDPNDRLRLSELAGGQKFIAQAPVTLLFCVDLFRLKRWAELSAAPCSVTRSFRHFWIAIQDTVICAQTICVAADLLGLGSVYVGTFLELNSGLREMFGLPAGVFPVVLLSLGYPATVPVPRNKLGVDVVVHHGCYRQLPDDVLTEALDGVHGGSRTNLSDDRIDRILQVCTAVDGQESAAQCRERIRSDGCVNAAQWLFGLHKPADRLSEGNAEYLEQIRQAGFDFLAD